MGKTYNIREAADCAELLRQGYEWVTVSPRGESKGDVMSRHKTISAADKAARGLDRQVVQVSDAAITAA